MTQYANGQSYVRKTVDKLELIELQKRLEQRAVHWESDNDELEEASQQAFAGIAVGIRKASQDMMELVGQEHPTRGVLPRQPRDFATFEREPVCR